jgi:hypothetical protein
MTAGIDADDEFPFSVIAVEFMVKPFHGGECFRILYKRIDDGKALGQLAGIFKLFIEGNDLVSK